MHERPNEARSHWTVDSGEQQAKQGADRNLLDIASSLVEQRTRKMEDAPNKTTGRTDARPINRNNKRKAELDVGRLYPASQMEGHEQ
jgi:hypothetical protein